MLRRTTKGTVQPVCTLWEAFAQDVRLLQRYFRVRLDSLPLLHYVTDIKFEETIPSKRAMSRNSSSPSV